MHSANSISTRPWQCERQRRKRRKESTKRLSWRPHRDQPGRLRPCDALWRPRSSAGRTARRRLGACWSPDAPAAPPLSSEKPPALAAARAVHPPRNGSRAGPRGRLTRPCVSPAVHWRRSGRCGWNLASGPPRPVAADEPPRLKLARAGRASTVPVAAVVGRVHHQSCVRHGGRGAAATCASRAESFRPSGVPAPQLAFSK